MRSLFLADLRGAINEKGSATTNEPIGSAAVGGRGSFKDNPRNSRGQTTESSNWRNSVEISVDDSRNST